MKKINSQKIQIGFTLVEMAIVLIIFGFLIIALLLPMQAQRNISKQLETEVILENSKKALLGFAQSKGYLPCPATNQNTGTFPDDTGIENPDGGGVCVSQVGFLPGSTLGLKPIDSNGFALDAWNNRIRYAVATENSYAFTTANQMNMIGLSSLDPKLHVCASATGITTDECSSSTNSNYLIKNAVAVIFSLGASGLEASGGNDENANLNDDIVFVSHNISSSNSVNGEFDHIVTWLSPYVLYNAMIQAGQLH